MRRVLFAAGIGLCAGSARRAAFALACILSVLWLAANLSWLVAVQYPTTMPGECVSDREGNRTCPPAGVTCMADIFDQVFCSQVNGKIFQDQYGKAVCAAGTCAPDLYGELYCASTANGTASVDPSGKVSCSDKCVKASSTLCRTPKTFKK